MRIDQVELAKYLLITSLAFSVAVALTGCGGGDASPVAPPVAPQVGISQSDSDTLAAVGEYAASYYGMSKGDYHLYYDEITRTTYPASYAGIPEGWYIYGLSWSNIAVVHSGLTADPWQSAVTASHEMCHVGLNRQGYTQSWYSNGVYVPYEKRWFEAECKMMGELLAIGYYVSIGKVPAVQEPDKYWVGQVALYPRPTLTTEELVEPVSGDSYNVEWSRKEI